MTTLTRTTLAFSLLLAGCASMSEKAGRDELTAQVGIYPPPGPGTQTIRIAIPAFAVTPSVEKKVAPLAADQLATLALNTQRFEVIERAQLEALLAEQSLEGIVTGNELARPAQVRGVEWLLLGKVTNLRVKSEQSNTGVGLGSIPVTLPGGVRGGFDWRDKNSTIKVECGVDLRLVDPTTGAVAAAEFGEYTRTDSIRALGVQVLGGSAGTDANLQVDEDSKGKILRLALDDGLRKMLPQVDRVLIARGERTAKAGPDAIDGK